MAVEQARHKRDITQIFNWHICEILLKGCPRPDDLDPVTLDKDNSILDQPRRTAE